MSAPRRQPEPKPPAAPASSDSELPSGIATDLRPLVGAAPAKDARPIPSSGSDPSAIAETDLTPLPPAPEAAPETPGTGRGGGTGTDLAPTARVPGLAVPASSRAPTSKGGGGGLGRIGLYELEGELGRGGMGTVYRAWHSAARQRVALKVIKPGMEESAKFERVRDLFLREGGILMSIVHPNVVRCIDVNEALHDGKPALYMALEYLEGQSLAQRLRQAPLPPREAVRVGREVALALEALHTGEQRVLHRDVTPGNIFLTSAGAVKLLDFGLASIADWRLNEVSMFAAGSRPYMSPEQFDGLRHCDERSDLYSLGVALFHAIAGRLPFESSTDQGFLTAHKEKSPPLLREVNTALPEGDKLVEAVQNVITRLLAKRPEERYPSALALAQELSRVEGGSIITAPKVTRPETVRLRKRLVQGVVLAALLATAGYAAVRSVRSDIPGRLAEARALQADGKLDASAQIIGEVLTIDPGNTEGRELQSTLAKLRGVRDRDAAEKEAAARTAKLEETTRLEREQREHDEATRRAGEAAAAQARLLEAQAAELGTAREEMDRGELSTAERRLTALEATIDPSRARDRADLLEAARRALEVRVRLQALADASAEGGPALAEALEHALPAAASLEGADGPALAQRSRFTAAQAKEAVAHARRDLSLAAVRAAEARGLPGPILEAVAAVRATLGPGDAAEAARLDEVERRVRYGRFDAECEAIAKDLADVPDDAEARQAALEAEARGALRSLSWADRAPLRELSGDLASLGGAGDAAARRATWEAAWRRLRGAAASGPGPASAAASRVLRGLSLLEWAAAARGRAPKERLVRRQDELFLGSEDAERQNPVHRVSLAPFYVDRDESDAAAYARFLEGRKDLPPPSTWSGRAPPAGRADLPARGISFDEAAAFAASLGKRLPSADEWEVAASVEPGSRGVRRRFPWGAEWLDEAATEGAPEPRSHGASKDRSPWGCLDMGGNVAEWTASPEGAVLKGGSFLDARRPSFFMAAHRQHPDADYREEDAGVRCAREVRVPEIGDLGGEK